MQSFIQAVDGVTASIDRVRENFDSLNIYCTNLKEAIAKLHDEINRIG